MRALTLAISLFLVSSTAFSGPEMSHDRTTQAAKASAIALAKVSKAAMGANLSKFKISVLGAAKIESYSGASLVNVEIGFDSGRGVKYSETYLVEITKAGFVKSIQFKE